MRAPAKYYYLHDKYNKVYSYYVRAVFFDQLDYDTLYLTTSNEAHWNRTFFRCKEYLHEHHSSTTPLAIWHFAIRKKMEMDLNSIMCDFIFEIRSKAMKKQS